MSDGQLYSAIFNTRLERISYLSSACLIGYEYLLQFDSEVEFFWKQKWSIAKVLFLWSRYYSVAFNVMNAIFFMQERPSLDLCTQFFRAQNTGAALQVITSHLILELRLYAMYSNTLAIRSILICLILCESLAIGLLFGLPNPNLVGTNEPYPTVFICADADPPDGRHWVVYYWSTILFVESTLLALSLRKAWLHRRQGSSLMQQLTKDSVKYYFFIFWIYLANTIIWYFNDITLDEVGTAPAFVFANILANRLLINVRGKYYRRQNRNIETYFPSIPVEDMYSPYPKESITFPPTEYRTALEGLVVNVDVETFDERIGA